MFLYISFQTVHFYADFNLFLISDKKEGNPYKEEHDPYKDERNPYRKHNTDVRHVLLSGKNPAPFKEN